MFMLLVAVAAVQSAAKPVDFTFVSPTAKSVQIAGDFDAWSKPIDLVKKGTAWSRSFDLPANARIEYKFIVDGKWVLDPTNPHRLGNGLGGDNSVWEGPRYRASVRDGNPKTPLNRTQLSVGGRLVIVFAPKESAGLPILTYGDGPSYEDPGKVQNIYENLVESRGVQPAVIVLVPPIDRMKEYGTGWKVYGNYLLDQVLPAVRDLTGASAAPKDLYIGGSSMGGVIALRLAEEFPNQIAGGVHSQSGAFQWSALNLNYDDAITEKNLRRLAPTTKLWFDWGTFEEKLSDSNLLATRTLRSMHRPYGSLVTPEGHNWTAWRNRMEAALIYLLKSKS